MTIGWPLIREDEYEATVPVRVRFKYRGHWECRDDEPRIRLTQYTIVGNPLDQPELETTIGDEWWGEFAHIACESEENE